MNDRQQLIAKNGYNLDEKYSTVIDDKFNKQDDQQEAKSNNEDQKTEEKTNDN